MGFGEFGTSSPSQFNGFEPQSKSHPASGILGFGHGEPQKQLDVDFDKSIQYCTLDLIEILDPLPPLDGHFVEQILSQLDQQDPPSIADQSQGQDQGLGLGGQGSFPIGVANPNPLQISGHQLRYLPQIDVRATSDSVASFNVSPFSESTPPFSHSRRASTRNNPTPDPTSSFLSTIAIDLITDLGIDDFWPSPEPLLNLNQASISGSLREQPSALLISPDPLPQAQSAPSQQNITPTSPPRRNRRSRMPPSLTRPQIIVRGVPFDAEAWAKAFIQIIQGLSKAANPLFDHQFSDQEILNSTISGRSGSGRLASDKLEAIIVAVTWMKNNRMDGQNPYNFREEEVGTLTRQEMKIVRKVFVERRNERKRRLLSQGQSVSPSSTSPIPPEIENIIDILAPAPASAPVDTDVDVDTDDDDPNEPKPGPSSKRRKM